MKTYTFTHLAKPRGKARSSFTGKGFITKNGKRRFSYDPKQNKTSSEEIAWAAKAAFGLPLLDGAIAVDMLINCRPLDSWSDKKRKQAIEGSQIFPTKKPDIDNIIKLYFDALNKLAWVDDRQVVSLTTHKRYAEEDGVTVTFWELGMPG